MASLASIPPAAEASAPSLTERRLRAEWRLLADLIALNPYRLTHAAAEDMTFRLVLHDTPALSLKTGELTTVHALRIVYPAYFPAVPLELYLAEPVLHPNIHPETGFVCLWDQHRVSNTLEHALHKTVSMLGWRLSNPDPQHIMQPAAAELDPAAIAARMHAAPLQGIEYPSGTLPERVFRRRLE